MRQITNSIKCLIVFGIWLLGFNTLSACNIKLKIVYTQADLRTIFDITPELFDKGLIRLSGKILGSFFSFIVFCIFPL